MYTDDSPEFSHIRAGYTKVVEKVLMLTGLTATQAHKENLKSSLYSDLCIQGRALTLQNSATNICQAKAAAADAISVETAIAKHTLPSYQVPFLRGGNTSSSQDTGMVSSFFSKVSIY